MPASTTKTPSATSMKVAEILSDLTSLRVVDPAAALALVSVRAGPQSADNTSKDDDDEDIQRAKSLVQLHYDVKEGNKRGELGRGLEEARRLVASVGVEGESEVGK